MENEKVIHDKDRRPEDYSDANEARRLAELAIERANEIKFYCGKEKQQAEYFIYYGEGALKRAIEYSSRCEDDLCFFLYMANQKIIEATKKLKEAKEYFLEYYKNK